MNVNRSFVALAAIVAIAMSSGVISAASGSTGAQYGGPKLAGSWDVAVDRPAPLSDLRSLQTFTRDGTVVEIANAGTALRTPSHGAWKRVGPQLYASTIVWFRFDPATGAYLGTHKVNRTITLSDDGNSYTGVGITTLYDPAGNVQVTGLRAPEAGVRIQVEEE